MSYEAIIIGAGMSGLAAGIRLAMFDKKVLILEKHSISGGLNSYYKRKKKNAEGFHFFDVGLHALTNHIDKGEKGKPFNKLLKQLRLNYDDFKLGKQNYSLISFPDIELKFSNDFSLLEREVLEKFPHEKDNFSLLVREVKAFNELDLTHRYQSTRAKLNEILKDDLLKEMLLCPLLIYGSAWEDDMDFAQFVTMFKALYFEGFSRPEGGVRTIINLLLERFKSLGGEIHYRSAVEKLIENQDKSFTVVTKEKELQTKKIFSSAGYPETVAFFEKKKTSPQIGNLTFVESIFVFDRPLKVEPTIVFYNNKSKYDYKKPVNEVDINSSVICFPKNYERTEKDETMARLTFIAQYNRWQEYKELSKEFYLEQKEKVANQAKEILFHFVGAVNDRIVFQDVFTPTTIERYTWHEKGTVYGSTDKTRDGKTPWKNLYIIGTDQGFLGIVGSILSGISMANQYGLMEEL